MENEDYITEYSKKYEIDNNIYLHCTKRGNSGNACPGKAKLEKETEKIIIYEKCNDKIIIHKSIGYENFKKLYHSDRLQNIDMNLNFTRNII